MSALAGGIPAIAAIRNALHRLQSLRRTIERQPWVDIRSEGGRRLTDEELLAADLVLEDVTFAYPSRPNTKVLDGLSVAFKAGQSTAIIGPSGSGKTSITQLLVRESDPVTANVPNMNDAAGKKGNYSWWKRRTQKTPESTPVERVQGTDRVLLGEKTSESIVWGSCAARLVLCTRSPCCSRHQYSTILVSGLLERRLSTGLEQAGIVPMILGHDV